MGPQKSGALPAHAPADSESFFDALQTWALMFAHNVVEPIMTELRRPESLDNGDAVITSTGATVAADCATVASEQTEAQESIQDFPKAHDIALPTKTAQKQSMETKTRDEALLILSNVSTASACCCGLTQFFRHKFCRVKGPSCTCKLLYSAFLDLT